MAGIDDDPDLQAMRAGLPAAVAGGAAPDAGVENDPDIMAMRGGLPDAVKGQAVPAKSASPLAAEKPVQTQFQKASAPATDQDWANKPWLDVGKEAIGNLPSSVEGVVGAIGHAIVNPSQTIEGIKDVGKGGASQIAGIFGAQQDPVQKQKNEAVIDALEDHLINSYTSKAGFKKAVATDPASVGMDVATALMPAASLEKSAGMVGNIGKAASFASKVADPIQASIAAAKAVGKGPKILGVNVGPVSAIRGAQSVATGVPSQALDYAAQAGASTNKTLRTAYLGARNGSIPETSIVQKMQDAVTALKRKTLDSLSAQKQGTYTLANAPLGFGKIDAALSDAKVASGLGANSGAVGAPEFLPNVKDGVSRAENLVNAWKSDPTRQNMQGFDELRNGLGQILSEDKDWNYQKHVGAIYHAVRGTMEDVSPDYTAALENISDAQNMFKEYKRTLGTGNNIMTANALARQIRAMKTPGGQDMLRQVSTVDETIPYLLAGASQHSILPTGIRGALAGVAGGEAAGGLGLLAHPAAWPAAAGAVATTLAATSPRVAGMMNYAYGVPTRYAASPFTKGAYYAGRVGQQADSEPTNATEVPAQQQAAEDTYFSKMLPTESAGGQFDKNGKTVISPKGAIGAAQIMPATAPEAAAAAGEPLDMNKLYNDADYNARLGKAYFHKLVGEMGSPEQAVAAYNAGPGAVQEAVQQSKKTGNSWIEHLPKETQNYLQRVVFGGNVNAERITRASGGRAKLDHGAEAGKLIMLAEKAKKTLGKATEPLLNVSDSHIAAALAAANESI